jgi:hypothetical protein
VGEGAAWGCALGACGVDQVVVCMGSAAACKKIAAALKARWAKVKPALRRRSVRCTVSVQKKKPALGRESGHCCLG